MIKKMILCVVMLGILSACQPEEETIVLPTRVSVATEFVAQEPTQVVVTLRSAPTLPPSATPQPTATPTTEIIAQPTPTREIDVGTIYYIYNGNSLIAVAGDGSSEEYLGPFDPPLPISDLTASPDGSLLAFVAPGSGSAREVWIANRNTTYVQSITCLGMPYIRDLAWSPDGSTIAFLAGQGEDSPLNVYSATWIDLGECPNNQQMLFDGQELTISNLTYHADGDVIFYGEYSEGINGFNTSSGTVTLRNLTRTVGYGADFALTSNPVFSPYLAYLESTSSTAAGKIEGYLNIIDVADNDLVYSQQTLVESIQWSNDGQFLLISERNRIYMYDVESGGTTDVTFDMQGYFRPRAIFSPDSSSVAYMYGGQENDRVQQIYVIGVNGENPRQLTFNTEGEIGDFVWVSGHWNEG